MSEEMKRPGEFNGPGEFDKPDEFERALQRALRRVDAPETLLRFLEAATEVKQERVLPWRDRKHKMAFHVSRPGAWTGARMRGAGIGMAAMLVLGLFVGEKVHVRHQREQMAEQQFETATRITDRTLERTRERLLRAGVPLE